MEAEAQRQVRSCIRGHGPEERIRTEQIPESFSGMQAVASLRGTQNLCGASRSWNPPTLVVRSSQYVSEHHIAVCVRPNINQYLIMYMTDDRISGSLESFDSFCKQIAGNGLRHIFSDLATIILRREPPASAVWRNAPWFSCFETDAAV